MNEADAVLPFSAISGVNQTESDLFTLAAFHCPVSQTANYTSSAGIPTYRYVYAGSFLETLSYPWLRPYHGSDLELVFKKGREDAYQDFGEEIKKAGRYLRDAVAAFVRGPEGNLVEFGWPRYEVGGEFMFSFCVPFVLVVQILTRWIESKLRHWSSFLATTQLQSRLKTPPLTMLHANTCNCRQSEVMLMYAKTSR